MPTEIGTRWGMQAYEPYLWRPEKLPYYNTMSPFTDLYLIQGGQRRSDLRVTFSRNITPDWNATLFYNRMSSNKVVFKTFRRNDDLNVHQTFGFSTRFFNRKHRYKLLAHFYFHNQNILETDGIDAATPLEIAEGGNYVDSLLRLENAQMRYRFAQLVPVNIFGRNFRLYHQYSLTKQGQIELFHIAEYRQDYHIWRDDNFNANRTRYPKTYFDENNTRASVYKNYFAHFDNKAGIKGRAGDLQYRSYIRRRSYEHQVHFIQDTTSLPDSASLRLPDEWSLGGGVRYYLDSTQMNWIDAQAEYLLFDTYKAKVQARYKQLSIEAERQSYRPDIIQRAYFGNHFKWNLDTASTNTIADRVYASYQLPTYRDVQVTPFVEYTHLQRLVYYDTMAIARQADENVAIWRAGFSYRAKWRQFYGFGDVFVSRSQGADLWRVPTVFINFVAYYESELFNKAMQAQIGVDVHYHSRYRAFAYMPITSQFHLQNDNLVGNYPLVNAFFNFKVKRAKLFFKINNLAQDLVGIGYYTTPFYIAQPRNFEFGVQWLFFD
jgi:hypothetical protein